MTDIKLDIQKHNELINDIKTFVLKETNVEINEIQALNLLDTILNDIKETVYDQALFQTRCEVLHKMANILGIEKGSIH